MTVLNPPRLLTHQVKYEQKAFWRNPAAAGFTFAFPLMFLVLFASLNSDSKVSFLRGVKYNQYFIPAIAAYGVVTACYNSLGIALPLRRDAGILKRVRSTPLPTWAAVGGYIGNSMVTAILLLTLTLGFGTVVYGLAWHGHLLALACTLVLGAATFCALGVAVAAVIPNGDAAGPIVNFTMLPVLLLSGTFFPINSTSAVSKIADYLPVRPFNEAMFAVFNPYTVGQGFDGRSMVVMALWLLAATVFAIRRFAWEPRRP